MNLTKTLYFISIIFIIYSAYYPQLSMTIKPTTINQQLSIHGHNISQLINAYNISDIVGQTTIGGVKAKYNLSNLHQKIIINWKGNIVTVKDTQTLNIHAKNVNLTLDGHLDLKIGLTRKQKGELRITITQLQLNVDLKFIASNCQNGQNGLGFGIQIIDIKLDISHLKIIIQGKGLDNLIIAQLQKIIIPRLPGIINNAIYTQINPLLLKLVCSKIQQKLPIGSQNYILTLNTTEVPSFNTKLQYLQVLLDITLQNIKTNQTNTQLEKDYLPQNNIFQKQNDVSIALSSNMLNTVIWTVADSKLINLIVTNQMLGPQPPILLNTTNLSILMPKLKDKWPNLEVFLMVQTAGQFQHLLIRSGRLVTVINLSIKFVVNITQNPSQNASQCIKSGGCVVACDLNMTLPLSLSLHLKQRYAYGLIHSAQFYQIKAIRSQIEINYNSLKMIINEIVNSMIPDLNNQLSSGMPLPDQILKLLQKFDISQINQQIFLDFIALGLNFKV